jgi:hypothetical protein
MRKWLRHIRGEHFAFTGKAWLQRHRLVDIVRTRGGRPTGGNGKVTSETTVLVRGDSSAWKYRKYGTNPNNSRFLKTRKASYGTNTLSRRCLNDQRRLSLG